MRAWATILTLLTVFSPGLAFATARPRVVISVDLNRNLIHVFKYPAGSNTPVRQSSEFLAVVPGSIRPGTYRARVPSERFKGERGASHLDNAVLFDGMHSIRSSAHFEGMKSHPIAGSVITPGDFGGLLFKTVKSAGGVATVVVRKT